MLGATSRQEKILAKNIWLDEFNDKEDRGADNAEDDIGLDQGSELRRAFAASQDMFPKVQQGLQLYKEWLSNKDPGDPDPEGEAHFLS